MCSKSFKSVEQRGHPFSLESFYFKTKHSNDISMCEREVQIYCRGTTQTNRNNHVVSSGLWGTVHS